MSSIKNYPTITDLLRRFSANTITTIQAGGGGEIKRPNNKGNVELFINIINVT